MGHIISGSKDTVPSRDRTDSAQIDGGNYGGSASGGAVLKKGPWTSAEDAILVDYVKIHGEGNWNAVQKHSGLFRCGKSCRLRWANHLRPNLKKGAFSEEEESLIIELHAKMGNKWARMAAHLPGRTDNEIKNYWNTRIKRHQRAGLPLYPPDKCLQAFQKNWQSRYADGNCSQDNSNQGHLQKNSFEISEVVFDSLKVNQELLPGIPELLDISSSGTLMKGPGSSHRYMPSTIHCPKRLRESMELSYPYTAGENHASPSSLNGNFSSSKPTPGAVKLELPSLQTDIDNLGFPHPLPFLESVDTFLQSLPSGLNQTDCFSPQKSGLLDALLHEATARSSLKIHSSEKSSNSSTVAHGDITDSSALNICPEEWEDLGEPIAPLEPSIFSVCTPISVTGNSLDDILPTNSFTECNAKFEQIDQTWILPGDQKETSTQLDLSRPDALLGSFWLDQSVAYTKEQGTVTDAIALLLGNDLGIDLRNMAGETSMSRQKWGFGSCTWNNMPPVCQMSHGS